MDKKYWWCKNLINIDNNIDLLINLMSKFFKYYYFENISKSKKYVISSLKTTIWPKVIYSEERKEITLFGYYEKVDTPNEEDKSYKFINDYNTFSVGDITNIREITVEEFDDF